MEKCKKCGRYKATKYSECECEISNTSSSDDSIWSAVTSSIINSDDSTSSDSSSDSSSGVDFGGGDFGGGGSGGEW